MTYLETEKVYFNTAGCGLISDETLSAGIEHLRRLQINPDEESFFWRMTQLSSTKKLLAELLDCSESEVAITPNFSYSFQSILSSLPKNSKILYLEYDYPSLNLCLELADFDLHRMSSKDHFDLGQASIEEELKISNYDFLAISHVQYLSGFALDLESLAAVCKSCGTKLIIDATQSLGAVDIRPKELGIDVLIASTYKWLNAGFGTACMYISENFISKYTPRIAGFGSLDFSQTPPSYLPSAKSYEAGQLGSASTFMLEQALKERLKLSVKTVEKRNTRLMEDFLQELRPNAVKRLLGSPNINNRTGIACLSITPDEASQLSVKHDFTYRYGIARIAFHFHNNTEQVTSFANSLNSLL